MGGTERAIQDATQAGKRGLSEVTITPNQEQYRSLVQDLEVLRAAGAESNTLAIIDAVHQAAKLAATMGKPSMPRQRGSAPGPAPGGKS